MRRLLPWLLPLLCGPLTWAQPAPTGNTTTEKSPPATSRIRGLFDFDLPNIDPPGTVKLIFNPHLSDLIRRDYLRIDGGFRWAINDHFEISPAAAIYLAHGLGGSSDAGYGIGGLRLGSKYILRRWPKADYETSLYLNAEFPIGQAPIDMTDGFNHISPGFLVQHRSTHRPKITTFAGAGLDLISASSVAGTPDSNQPLDDSMNFTAGAIYDLGHIKWTLTTTYATTAVLGDTTEHFFHVRPSLLWYVPKKYTFNYKTQWIVGLGVRATWGPDGTELSLRTRLRAEITFRQMMEKMRRKRATEAPR